MRIVAVSTSSRKGEKKVNQPQVTLVANHGVEGDVHADGTHRQLSLLAMEDIEYMRSMGADVHPGDCAENITTEGVELHTCPLGTRFTIGDDIELVLTQIGKGCHGLRHPSAGGRLHHAQKRRVLPHPQRRRGQARRQLPHQLPPSGSSHRMTFRGSHV